VCINCEKEGHTIHTCYKLFPQMRSVEGGEKQDQKGNFKRDGFKGKKNSKAMHSDTWDDDEKENGESEIGPSNDGHSPFYFMAQVNLGDIDEEEEKDFEAIIAKNELTDPIIIEYLRKLHLAKKKVGEPTKVTTQEEVTKEEEKDETSSSSTKEVQGENKVEASSSPPPKETNVCLVSSHRENVWILDSGCSHHMTGFNSNFSSLEPYDGGTVTFGNNKRNNKIIGISTIGVKNLTISNVYLVDGLNFNLLSINQLCDAGFYVKFDVEACYLINGKINEIVYKGSRIDDMYNLYFHHFKQGETCLSASINYSWL
jgi:hypothetical protein